MRVVIFGAGAVGGHLAAQLEAMNQRGITLWIGEERTSAPIHATDRPETLGHQTLCW